MLIEAAKIATIVVLTLIIVAGAARSQQDQPMVQCTTELTKTSRERDAGSDYVAAVLTQLADAKMQAAAANQQIAADQARIANLTNENAALTKERDELKAKVSLVGSPPPPRSSTFPQIDSAP
jgi:hypothetical protein